MRFIFTTDNSNLANYFDYIAATHLVYTINFYPVNINFCAIMTL